MESASTKDKSSKELLTKLFNRFGEANFELTDYWDADLNAIGIKNSTGGDFLIYISTYLVQEDLYFVEVEDSGGEAVLNGYRNGNLKEIDFEELSELVTKYLHLQPIYEK